VELRDRSGRTHRSYNPGVVPDRQQSAAVLLSLRPPGWFLAHVSTTAEVAGFLALRIARSGTDHNRALVEAAALLHDVDKLLPGDGPLAHLEHGEAGARWLAERGCAELGLAVAGHPVRRLVSDDAARWVEAASLEVRVVSYADKRAGQRLQSIDARFADWERRFPQYRAGLARARRHADRLERDVCAAARITPEEVRRLPWVSRALERADAARSRTGES
jgi:hypothetical protein